MNKALKRALERQREITEAARSENRNLTEAEQREFDSLTAIIEGFTEDGGRTDPERSNPEPSAQENEPKPSASEGGGQRQAANIISAQDAAQIANMCRQFGMDAGEFLSRGLTVEQASREIIQRQMEQNPPLSTGVQVTNDEGDKRRRAMVDGMLLRGGSAIEKPAEGANSYRGFSIREITAECLERENPLKDYRHMSKEDILREATRAFYNPESEFPAILDEVVQKSYVEGLDKARVTFDKWVKFGTLPNFKKTTNHEYIMSLAGELEKVPENGELKAYVPRDVLMPERQLETYGRQFTMTRKAFIDDDIGVVTSLPRRFAEQSLNTQNKLVYSILLNNKKIFDGKLLFSAERKNTLTTGSLPTLEVIQQMIYMIGIQKDEADDQLALKPDMFLVPFGMGVEFQKILTTPTIYSAEGTIANPYYGSGFEIIEDVTLNGFIKDGEAIPWFMGVKGEIIQMDYLNGQRNATIKRGEVPGKLGFVWDVYHDFGVSVLHPQAVCRNPGVKFDASGIVSG